MQYVEKATSGDRMAGAVRSLAAKSGLPVEFVVGLAARGELRSVFDESGKIVDHGQGASGERRATHPRQAQGELDAKRPAAVRSSGITPQQAQLKLRDKRPGVRSPSGISPREVLAKLAGKR